MIAQPAPGAVAGVVRGVAERLPFGDDSFDAAMAVLTMHHWPDWRRGVAEMKCVARERVVVLTFDPAGRREEGGGRRVQGRKSKRRSCRCRRIARTGSWPRTGGGRRGTWRRRCGRGLAAGRR